MVKFTQKKYNLLFWHMGWNHSRTQAEEDKAILPSTCDPVLQILHTLPINYITFQEKVEQIPLKDCK